MSVSNWPCETTLPTSDDVKSTHNSDPLFFKLSRRNISQDTTAPFLKIVFTTSTFVLLFFRCTVVRVHTEPEILGQAGDHQHHHHNHQPNHDWGVGGGRWGGVGETIQGFISEGGKVSLTRGHHTMTLHFRYLQVSLFAEWKSPPPSLPPLKKENLTASLITGPHLAFLGLPHLQ